MPYGTPVARLAAWSVHSIVIDRGGTVLDPQVCHIAVVAPGQPRRGEGGFASVRGGVEVFCEPATDIEVGDNFIHSGAPGFDPETDRGELYTVLAVSGSAWGPIDGETFRVAYAEAAQGGAA